MSNLHVTLTCGEDCQGVISIIDQISALNVPHKLLWIDLRVFLYLAIIHPENHSIHYCLMAIWCRGLLLVDIIFVINNLKLMSEILKLHKAFINFLEGGGGRGEGGGPGESTCTIIYKLTTKHLLKRIHFFTLPPGLLFNIFSGRTMDLMKILMTPFWAVYKFDDLPLDSSGPPPSKQ
jgi:hypothetical protein